MGCTSSKKINVQPLILQPRPSYQHHQIKLLMSGDTNVGKTCLVTHHFKGTFENNHYTTIGLDFMIQDYELDGETYKLQIWDTAGQERFRTLTNTFYRHCVGVFIVFDVTCRKSFERIIYWIEEVYRNTFGHIPIILIGNKIDLDRQVSYDEAQMFASQHHCSYFETSAKNNIGLKEAIDKMMKFVLKKIQ
jgi:small GTP-binding protein